MVEQFAVFRASQGERVAFITVESPAPFVVAALKLRAQAMGLNFEEFKDNIILTAGGIAKLAYKMVKEGQEAETLMHYCGLIIEDTMKHLDIPWAYTVLKHLKGTKYPITGPEVLKEKLKDVRIKTLPATEVVEKLHYPIKNPAQLLHEINMVISTEEGK